MMQLHPASCHFFLLKHSILKSPLCMFFPQSSSTVCHSLWMECSNWPCISIAYLKTTNPRVKVWMQKQSTGCNLHLCSYKFYDPYIHTSAENLLVCSHCYRDRHDQHPSLFTTKPSTHSLHSANYSVAFNAKNFSCYFLKERHITNHCIWFNDFL